MTWSPCALPSNKAAVATKNQARANLKNSARLLAKLVEGTASVTNAQKLTLGLNVRAQPTPILALVAPGDLDRLRAELEERGLALEERPIGEAVDVKEPRAALHAALPRGHQRGAMGGHGHPRQFDHQHSKRHRQ